MIEYQHKSNGQLGLKKMTDLFINIWVKKATATMRKHSVESFLSQLLQ